MYLYYMYLYITLLIDITILYVKLITFHGLYDKLSTNVQRQLGQYEENPANMKISQSDARIRSAFYEFRINYPFRSPFWNWRFSSKLFHLCGAPWISSKTVYNYLKKLTSKENVQSINKIVIN